MSESINKKIVPETIRNKARIVRIKSGSPYLRTIVPTTVPTATPEIMAMIPRHEIFFHDLQRTYISAGIAIKRSKTTIFVRG
jgi:hypothetical protein